MSRIWAIAKTTLFGALRMKAAAAVIALLAALLPLLGVATEGDGTLLGKLQTFSSYGLGLVNLLLCLLAASLACWTVSVDLKRMHIQLISTKPVRRWEIVAGKTLGLLILNAFLLILFGATVYGLVRAMPRYVASSDAQRFEAEKKFFNARAGLKVKIDEAAVRKAALARFEELKQKNLLPSDMSQVRILSELIGQERMAAKSCAPGQEKRWDFESIPVRRLQERNAAIFIRFKLESTSMGGDGRIYDRWLVGDARALDAGVERPKTPIFRIERDSPPRTAQEFAVPAAAVAEDGFLSVVFFNDPSLNPGTIILDDVEALFDSGSFEANFARALGMIYIRLAFLSMLGVSLATWLSFPVAALTCLVVFFLGLTNGFMMEALDSLGQTAGAIYQFTIKPIFWLLPKFDGIYNPGSYLIDGRLIEGLFLAQSAFWTAIVKGGAALLFGIWVFSRRELARIEI